MCNEIRTILVLLMIYFRSFLKFMFSIPVLIYYISFVLQLVNNIPGLKNVHTFEKIKVIFMIIISLFNSKSSMIIVMILF